MFKNIRYNLPFFAARLEASAAHPPEQGSAEGGEEEPEEVQRPVQRQGQDAAQQGQQGAGQYYLELQEKNVFVSLT